MRRRLIPNLRRPQPVELEQRRLGRRQVEFEGAVAAVLEELDAGKRRAKPDVKRTPMAGLGQRKAHALDGVAEKRNLWHAGEQAAFPKHEIGMKMADDGAFDLAKTGANGVIAPQGGQRGRVMAKQDDALRRFQIREGAADFAKLFLARLTPGGPFLRQSVRLECGQRQKGRGHAENDVVAHVNAPEGRQVQYPDARGGRPPASCRRARQRS